MIDPIVVTGELKDAKTIVLDEPLPVAAGRVEVAVRVVPTVPPPKLTLEEFVRELRARQAARGHSPRTAEEIREAMRIERASWGD